MLKRGGIIKIVFFIAVVSSALLYLSMPEKERASNKDFVIEDGVLLSYKGNETTIIIPKGVTSIEKGAFSGNKGITKVIFSNHVKEIGAFTFSGCEKLEEVILSKNLVSIGDEAFSDCLELKDIVLPKKLKSIGTLAFKGCKNLSNITIPSGVSDFGYHCFSGTPWMRKEFNKNSFWIINDVLVDGTFSEGEVIVPDGVVKISEKAFEGCEELNKIILPASVREIKDSAFMGCGELESVVLSENLISIGEYVFGYCEKLSDINIPKGVTDFGCGCFDGTPWMEAEIEKSPLWILNNIIMDGKSCEGSIEIPEGVRKIQDGAFSQNDKLSEIKIPDTVKKVGDYAFYECKNLFDIKIPKDLTNIGYQCFHETLWMEEKIKENPLCIINGILVNGEYCKGSVEVPEGVTKIQATAFRWCEELSKIKLSSSIKEIETKAFEGCTGLIEIEIPYGLEKIGEYAFADCTGLPDIVLPDSVTSIGEGAFDKGESEQEEGTFLVRTEGGKMRCKILCDNLDDGTGTVCIGGTCMLEEHRICDIPSVVEYRGKSYTVTQVGEEFGNDFHGMYSYYDEYEYGTEQLILPNTIESISSGTFFHANTLKEVYIPASVKNIGMGSFVNCENIEKFIIDPENPYYKYENGLLLSKDGKKLISAVKVEKECVIPEEVEEIGDYAFASCQKLKKIKVPTSVVKISSKEFPKTVTLQVYQNSYAHQFAKKNKIKFSVIS